MKILGYCVKLKNFTTSKGRGYALTCSLSGAWTALESALKMLLNLFFLNDN